MTSFLRTVWPIIVIALLASASGWLVEDPIYPVSLVHPCLVFLLGLVAVFYIKFSTIRQSYGGYACGTSIGYLALTVELFPDLWLRWPAVSSVGFGISQILAFIAYPAVRQNNSRRYGSALAIAVISLLPLSVTPYFQIPQNLQPYLVFLGLFFLCIGAWGAIGRRQSRSTLIGISSWVILSAIAVGFAVLALNGYAEPVEVRQQAEQVLLLAFLCVSGIFVGEALQIEQQLRTGKHMDLEASFRDPLTNIANRRALETYGPRLISQSHEAGRAVSLIVVDLDHFKEINDTHGHLAGDAVLRQTAVQLAAQVRKSDLVARYGGEEFVIILPGSPLAPALRLAEKMRTALEEERIRFDSTIIQRTASFGVATAFPEEPASLSELIQRADTNLYRAKHEGRNRVKADELPASDF